MRHIWRIVSELSRPIFGCPWQPLTGRPVAMILAASLLFFNRATGRSPELKEGRLQKLCKMFTHREELRVLVRKGLNIDDYVVEYHFTRNSDDLKGIAYSLLKDWMATQENRTVAYA